LVVIRLSPAAEEAWQLNRLNLWCKIACMASPESASLLSAVHNTASNDLEMNSRAVFPINLWDAVSNSDVQSAERWPGIGRAGMTPLARPNASLEQDMSDL
jgi:hypothetical protein